MVAHIPHSPHATRHAVEVAAEVMEAQHPLLMEFFAMQMTTVHAYATIQRPPIQLFAGRGVETDVEQPIGRDEELLTEVLRLLPHALHASRQLPTVKFMSQVAHIVGHCMEFEEQSRF